MHDGKDRNRFLFRIIRRMTLPLLFLAFVLVLAFFADATARLLAFDDATRVGFEQFIQTGLWLAGAWVFSRVFTLVFWDGFVRQALERRPPRFVIQIGGAIIFLVALSGILQSVFDEPVTALWATSGVVGVVIGLALQTLILDTFSGLAIQMERPFKIGDWINCHTRFGEYMGRVEETNWRTTRLWSDDGNIIVIPNSFLTTTIVTNLSMPDNVRRFELVFVLDFAAEPEHVIKVMQAAAQEA